MEEPPVLTPFISFTHRQLARIEGFAAFSDKRIIDDEEVHP